ncbi:hypothetical protein P7K49_029143 [Saguinus oedipus]|uniref:Uncharacterized protein n=1 Tax=Saguinus oedipus TaxID=9490 RepID=A0ABQ9U6D4_SAGOE|nr:hypothetical protein P7K49_029143 [Saguinus oedipus]
MPHIPRMPRWELGCGFPALALLVCWDFRRKTPKLRKKGEYLFLTDGMNAIAFKESYRRSRNDAPKEQVEDGAQSKRLKGVIVLEEMEEMEPTVPEGIILNERWQSSIRVESTATRDGTEGINLRES